MQNNNNDPMKLLDYLLLPDIKINRLICLIYQCYANKIHGDRLIEIENEYIINCDKRLRDVMMNARHPISEYTVIDRLVHHLHNNPHELTSLKIMDLYHTNRNKIVYTENSLKSNWLLNTCINTAIQSQYKINKIKCDIENKQYSLHDICHWNYKLINECIKIINEENLAQYSYDLWLYLLIKYDILYVVGNTEKIIETIARRNLGLDYISDIKISHHIDPTIGSFDYRIMYKDGIPPIISLDFSRFLKEPQPPSFDNIGTKNEWLDKKMK